MRGRCARRSKRSPRGRNEAPRSVNDPLERFTAAVAERYVIDRELGRGGMAFVYLARDRKHDRAVALKVLRPDLAAVIGSERFLREIQIAARLAHPHILPVHDSGEAGGFLYYVMPYVEGESLRQRLFREGPLPLGQALQIAREVADALSYAHSHDVVHRDIKPENILLTGGHAVVADFGIARAITAAAGDRLTGGGFAVGTPGYMSPEQAENDRVDGRSDLYSLACVLYEMLAGEPAFTGRSAQAVLAQQSAGHPRDVRAVRGSVPEPVERAIMRALAKVPADRFSTPTAFAAALAADAAPSGPVGLRSRGVRVVLVLAGVAVIGVVLALRTRVLSRAGAARAAATELSASAAPEAAARLLEGRARFWGGDLDGAAAAYRRALEADSDLALAYHRLSVVETWRWDYPAARRVVEAGLARGDRLAPRWRELLEAQRHYVMRNADSAIADFQRLAADFPRMPDVWYGLGEALFHFAGAAGHRPADARRVFEHLAALDSTFAPMYHHLVDLALYQGDRQAARTFLGHIRADDPDRPAAEAAMDLTFGDRELRARTLMSLRQADRSTLSLLVAHFAHDALALPLADTIAGYLMQPDRTPDDRLRGAQYRLVTRAGQGEWDQALAAWDVSSGGPKFDRWMVLADLAGFPARRRADPMLAWARSLLAANQRLPDFTRPVWEEAEQAFGALAQRAAVKGDSAEVSRLLGRLEAVARRADVSDPVPPALRAALRARLILLAGDTTGAIQLLERAVSRAGEPFEMFFPVASMAPQRWQLVELHLARGDRAQAARWLGSFSNTWSLGDVLYAPRVACLRKQLGGASAALETPRGRNCGE